MQLMSASPGLLQHLPSPAAVNSVSTKSHYQLCVLSFPPERQASPSENSFGYVHGQRHVQGHGYGTHRSTATSASTEKSSEQSSQGKRTDSPNIPHDPNQSRDLNQSIRPTKKPPQPEELPSDFTELVQWGGRLPPSRRLVVGAAAGLAVALGSDFIGITSALLGLAPDLSRELRADLVYPVQGFKRCYEASRGFEFLYPATWVGDQRLVYRAVERAERQRSLDLPSLRAEQARNRRRAAVEPLVAFGPPGGEGELNVSVVVAPLAAGFSLEKLGSPSAAGERFLGTMIAPEGSGKEARLLGASKRITNSLLYYVLEYNVHSPTFYRHNVSVYVAYNDLLYTLNAQTPESLWPEMETSFRTVAASFSIDQSVGGAPTQDVPKSL